MDLKRFFCSEKITGDKAYLFGNEFYHAVKVTRHKIGYKLILCDNGDYDYYATVIEIGDDYLCAQIDKKIKNPVESDFNLTLYIGNNKDLDCVIQKAVELGVTNIVPFFSSHCNVKNINLDRLDKIIMESSKQCGRSQLTNIQHLFSFSEMLSDAKNKETFAFYEYEKENTVKNTVIHGNEIGIVIGPEGGFSIEEIHAFNDNGIKTYTLGKRILRVSTAVVAGCVLINDKMDGID